MPTLDVNAVRSPSTNYGGCGSCLKVQKEHSYNDVQHFRVRQQGWLSSGYSASTIQNITRALRIPYMAVLCLGSHKPTFRTTSLRCLALRHFLRVHIGFLDRRWPGTRVSGYPFLLSGIACSAVPADGLTNRAVRRIPV